MNKSDHEIIEGIKSGDRLIIEDFYQYHFSNLKNYILNRSGIEKDAEDTFQEALTQVYQKITTRTLSLNKSIHSYFFGICKNLWKKSLVKSCKILSLEEYTPEEGFVDTLIIGEESKLKSRLFSIYLNRLNTNERQIIQLVIAGNSISEISEIMGYSEKYTRRKKFLVKQKLIELLEKDQLFKEFYER